MYIMFGMYMHAFFFFSIIVYDMYDTFNKYHSKTDTAHFHDNTNKIQITNIGCDLLHGSTGTESNFRCLYLQWVHILS